MSKRLLLPICAAACVSIIASRIVWRAALEKRTPAANAPAATTTTGWTSTPPPRDEHWEVAYSHLGTGFTNAVNVEWIMRLGTGLGSVSTNQIQIGLLENGAVVWRKRPVDFKPYTLEDK